MNKENHSHKSIKDSHFFDPIFLLPEELRSTIISYLPTHEQLSLKFLSKQWNTWVFPAISCLNLSHRPKLKDIDFYSYVSHLSNLTSIDLSKCSEIRDGVFPYFSRHTTKLKKLNIWECCKISPTGLRLLSELSSLDTLYFPAKDTPGKFTSLDVLTCFTNLCTIGINWAPPNLVVLTSLTNLKSVYLGPFFDVGDFSFLAFLTKVHALHIVDWTNVDNDEGMKDFSTFSNINTLTFKDCERIENEGMVHLSTLTNLRKLVLDNTPKITDEGLSHLSKLTNLKIIRPLAPLKDKEEEK